MSTRRLLLTFILFGAVVFGTGYFIGIVHAVAPTTGWTLNNNIAIAWKDSAGVVTNILYLDASNNFNLNNNLAKITFATTLNPAINLNIGRITNIDQLKGRDDNGLVLTATTSTPGTGGKAVLFQTPNLADSAQVSRFLIDGLKNLGQAGIISEEAIVFDNTVNMLISGYNQNAWLGGDGAATANNFLINIPTSPARFLKILGANTLILAINSNGVISTYNAISTAGLGVSAIYAVTSQRTETGADTNLLTYTPPATAGNYRLCFTMGVSAATAATLGWTATWTDSNGAAQAPTNLDLEKQGVAAPALTFVATANDAYFSCVTIDINNSATNIVVKTTFTGTSFTSKDTVTIEQLA